MPTTKLLLLLFSLLCFFRGRVCGKGGDRCCTFTKRFSNNFLFTGKTENTLRRVVELDGKIKTRSMPTTKLLGGILVTYLHRGLETLFFYRQDRRHFQEGGRVGW
jgi:hypothetical protein